MGILSMLHVSTSMSTSVRAIAFTYQVAFALGISSIYDNWPCDVRPPSFVAEPLLGDEGITTMITFSGVSA
jgi:hypothetical protein